MKTIVVFDYIILTLEVGLLFLLIGFLYQMRQSNRKKTKSPQTCDHRFLFEDVMDITVNPKCTKCGEKLSEVKN